MGKKFGFGHYQKFTDWTSQPIFNHYHSMSNMSNMSNMTNNNGDPGVAVIVI